MTNYKKTDNKYLFSVEYLYVDVPELYADKLLLDAGIKVRFKKGAFNHKDSEYKIIFCKINKKDEEKFLEVMEKLQRKIILSGRSDYIGLCEYVMSILSEE